MLKALSAYKWVHKVSAYKCVEGPEAQAHSSSTGWRGKQGARAGESNPPLLSPDSPAGPQRSEYDGRVEHDGILQGDAGFKGGFGVRVRQGNMTGE